MNDFRLIAVSLYLILIAQQQFSNLYSFVGIASMRQQTANSFKCHSFLELSNSQRDFFETKKKEFIKADFKPANQNYIKINGSIITNRDVYCMLATCLYNQQILQACYDREDSSTTVKSFKDLQKIFLPAIQKNKNDFAATIKQTISEYNSYEKLIATFFKKFNQQDIKKNLQQAINNKKCNESNVQIYQMKVTNQKVQRKKFVKHKGVINNLIVIVQWDQQVIVAIYHLKQKAFIQQASKILIKQSKAKPSQINLNQARSQLVGSYQVSSCQVGSFQVPIKRIEKQPFEMENQPNHLHVGYTVFAGRRLLLQLGIQINAYRKIKVQNKSAIILIFYDPNYDQDQHLYVPYQIFKFVIQSRAQRLKSIQSKRQTQYVQILKERYGLTNISNYELPSLPILDQLRIFNSQQIDTDFINSLVSQYPFVVQKFAFGVYHIDMAQIDARRIQGNWKMQAVCKRKAEENKRTKITNYLRVRLSWQDHQSLEQISCGFFLFKPGHTKIVNLKSLERFQNFCTEVQVSNLYQRILCQPSYSSLFQKISGVIRSAQIAMIALHLQRGNGVLSLLHEISQANCLNMIVYDCIDFTSPKQLYQKLKAPSSHQGSLVYIKNSQWLRIIAGASSTNSGTHSGFQPYKNALRTIQKVFNQASKMSLQKNILIVQSQQPVDSQLFQNAETISFILTKQQKLTFISWVLKSIDFIAQDIQSDNIVFKTALSVGWARFLKITESFAKKLREKIQISKLKEQSMAQNNKYFLEQLVKQIHKYTKVEKVQNIANITWDDIGGLETAKEEIIETIMLPTKHPQIFDQKIPPRTGLLFYGPPGTGKTMLGKCIANQCKMGFISVKGPQLLNMYIGQSEKNLRRLFQRAYKSRPCIVFMDELDALIPKKGNSGDSNQVMDRIVSQLLMQMDIAGSNGIFIIGATNRPDLLDPSILVAGRFDKQVYLGISKNKADQLKILEAQTRHLKLDKQLDLKRILDVLPENLTGADFYGLTSKAIMNSMQRVVAQYEQQLQQTRAQSFSVGDMSITVRQQDFLQAAKTLVPSVSEQQLRHYQTLRQKYS